MLAALYPFQKAARLRRLSALPEFRCCSRIGARFGRLAPAPDLAARQHCARFGRLTSAPDLAGSLLSGELGAEGVDEVVHVLCDGSVEVIRVQAGSFHVLGSHGGGDTVHSEGLLQLQEGLLDRVLRRCEHRESPVISRWQWGY